MGEFFDLLQAEVESRDGVCDQTLTGEQRKCNTHQQKHVELCLIIFSMMRVCFQQRTSGGVFVVGVVSDALDEALEGEGLTESFESLSASVFALPFTCENGHYNRQTDTSLQKPSRCLLKHSEALPAVPDFTMWGQTWI